MTPQEIVKEFLLYNTDSGELIWIKKTGRSTRLGSRAGSVIPSGRKIHLNGTSYRSDELVWLYHHGEYPSKVYHVDSDIFNDKIENLTLNKPTEVNQEVLRQLFTYNEDTGELKRKSSTRAVTTLDNDGYIVVSLRDKTYKSHRLIWEYMTGETPKHTIDHINGIRNDNRWCNLRLATIQENSYNQKVSKNNTTGIKGLVYEKNVKNPWAANVQHNGTRVVKRFSNKEDAIEWLRITRENFNSIFCNHG